MFVVSKLLGWLLVPGNLLIVLLFLVCLRRPRRGRRGAAFLLATLLFACAVLPVGELMLWPLENRFSVPAKLPAHVDGIIVLGGAVLPTISAERHAPQTDEHAERLAEGVYLARLYPDARLVHSGGTAAIIPGAPKEAGVAAAYFARAGIPPKQVVLEDRSRNTYENALFTYRMLKPKPDQTWILVTSADHMPRAVGVFRHVGWHIVPWPVDYYTGTGVDWSLGQDAGDRLTKADEAAHEWIGLVYYYLRGWTDSLFPGPARGG